MEPFTQADPPRKKLGGSVYFLIAVAGICVIVAGYDLINSGWGWTQWAAVFVIGITAYTIIRTLRQKTS